MSFVQNYNKNIVKYDLINKFNCKIVNKLPKIKSITLTINTKKKLDIKLLISFLAALKIISSQNPKISRSKTSNLLLNIREGHPVGCKVNLNNKQKDSFINLLINNLPLTTAKRSETENVFSCKIDNILKFDKLEKNYAFFKNISQMNISVQTTHCQNQKLMFLLKSNKLFS